ncbi:hypothetical protein [Pontibacter rugosus]
MADHPTHHLRALSHLQIGNIYSKQKSYKRALSLYKQALVIEPTNEAARYNYELLKKYLELHPEAVQPEEDLPVPDEETEAAPDSIQAPPPAEEDLESQPKKNSDERGEQQEEIEQPEPDSKGEQQQKMGARELENLQGNREREEAAVKLLAAQKARTRTARLMETPGATAVQRLHRLRIYKLKHEDPGCNRPT